MNGQSSRAFVDLGSTCNLIREGDARRMGLKCDKSKGNTIRGYGGGLVTSRGTLDLELEIDNVKINTKATVVPDSVQSTPLLIGHPVSERTDVAIFKDESMLTLFRKLPGDEVIQDNHRKVGLWPKDTIVIPKGFWCNVPVIVEENIEGDLYVEASIRSQEGREYCIPHVILQIDRHVPPVVPVVNLSENDIELPCKNPIARGWPCSQENKSEERVFRINVEKIPPLTVEDITVGPITNNDKKRLLSLINKYRECFAKSIDEIGCAKSVEISIELEENKPFAYRPYHMSKSEQKNVKSIVADLLRNNIIRESNSPYSSPVLLVRKKNGEHRLQAT